MSEREWILNTNQAIFMLTHHNAIETAYANEDMKALRKIAASKEYRKLFGKMTWDEAYDRYETMLEQRSK